MLLLLGLLLPTVIVSFTAPAPENTLFVMLSFISDLPLLPASVSDTPPLNPSGSINPADTHGGDVSCVYLFYSAPDALSQRLQHPHARPAHEINVVLHHTLDGQTYQIKKKAFLYAPESNGYSIYTLPALLHFSSLPIALQQLVLESTSATSNTSNSASTSTSASSDADTADDAATDTNTDVGAVSNSSKVRLHFSICIERLGVVEQELGTADFVIVTADKKSANPEDHYFEYLERWLAFFDYLIRTNQVGEFSSNQLVRFSELNKMIRAYCGEGEQITRSRILEIAENAAQPLRRLENKLRKSLLNTRKMLPVERINELDGKCIDYILRLEGNTLREKAQKNKMRLLGLAKEETYNLLENRVLKDFLERCINKSTQYIKEITEYSNADKVQANSSLMRQMKVFKQRCQDLSTKTPLSTVPRQTTLPKPNFVLQKDPDYKKIWRMYLDLIHEKRDLDQTLYCQQNLFQDICDVMLNAVLCDLCEQRMFTKSKEFTISTISKSYVDISLDQLNGHRIKLGCEAGPFLVQNYHATFIAEVITNGSNKLEYLQSLYRQDTNKDLIAAPAYVLFTTATSPQNAFRGGQQHHIIMPFFSLHCAFNTKQEQERLEQRISKELAKVRGDSKVPMFPCFIISTHGTLKDANSYAATAATTAMAEQEQFTSHRTLSGQIYFVTKLSLQPRFWLHNHKNLANILSGVIGTIR